MFSDSKCLGNLTRDGAVSRKGRGLRDLLRLERAFDLGHRELAEIGHAQQCDPFSARPAERRVGGAREQHEHRSANGGDQVHGPGVVAHGAFGAAGEPGDLGERG